MTLGNWTKGKMCIFRSCFFFLSLNSTEDSLSHANSRRLAPLGEVIRSQREQDARRRNLPRFEPRRRAGARPEALPDPANEPPRDSPSCQSCEPHAGQSAVMLEGRGQRKDVSPKGALQPPSRAEEGGGGGRVRWSAGGQGGQVKPSRKPSSQHRRARGTGDPSRLGPGSRRCSPPALVPRALPYPALSCPASRCPACPALLCPVLYHSPPAAKS